MLQVRRPIHVVALTTEALKAQLAAEVDTAIEQLNAQAQQLEGQGRQQLAEFQNNIQRLMEARRELDQARQQQEELRQQFKARRVEIDRLEMGTPILRGEIEGVVEINVGDNLAEKLRPAEIVVEDDVVVSINGA